MFEVLFNEKFDIQEVLTAYWECLSLTDRERKFAEYRFGLHGQEKHTRKDAAEHFEISIDRAALLERKILRPFRVRQRKKLEDF